MTPILIFSTSLATQSKLTTIITTPLAFSIDPLPGEGGLVWALILGCGLASLGVFVWLWGATRQSKNELRESILKKQENLRALYLQSLKRIQKIDNALVDKLRSLSPKGSEASTMARQILAKIGHRVNDIDRLLESNSVGDMLQAQELLTSPIDNTGNQFDTIVFAETILTLQPDQFGLALDMIIDIAEADLDRPSGVYTAVQTAPPMHVGMRQRKFTIRGFLKTLSGKA